MSDMTIEELQAENEALKTKNAELLDEVKKAKVSRAKEGLQEKIDALEAEKAEMEKRLHYHDVEKPRMDLMNSITPNEHLAGAAMREILHHYDIGEDGGLLNKQNGAPVTIEVEIDKYGNVERQPLSFDEAGINNLYMHGILPSLGSMLNGSKASGGGAPGNNGRDTTPRNPEPEKKPEKQEPAPAFGMR